MPYGTGNTNPSKDSKISSKPATRERDSTFREYLGEKPLINRPSISMKPSIDNIQLQVGFTPDVQNFDNSQNNAEIITLNREVFNKEAFNNTVDTSFSQLDQSQPDLSFFDPNLATIKDFFNIYQNLFFQIPKFGDIQSHQYLVIESTEYTGYIENQAQIDALLEEITDLREENLQLNLDVSQLLGVNETIQELVAASNSDGTNSLDDILTEEAEIGAAQGNSSSDNLGTPNPNNTTGIPSSGGGGSGGGGGGGGQSPFSGDGQINPMGQGFDPLVQTGFGFGRPNSNLQQSNY
tara:strand:- start:379 stop:1260 length:882 start_codon:yes stop_codon:yes gene_type:complete